MGLLSFLKRRSPDGAATKPAAAVTESVDSVQQARTRARQRLVGAVVLVAAGVVGFPLLFETQPRPLPGDLPIDVARRDGGPAAVPASRTPPAARANVPPSVVTESPADAAREVVTAAPTPAPPVASAATETKPRPVASQPEARPQPAPEPKPPAPKPEAKPETKPADSARAQALLDGKDAAHKPAAADGRFIVQVGAFAEATAAREARQKVEKLGLKTYTQVVETSGGKRIRVRVGPFASRDEADKASAKIKSAGLSSAVYTL
jgi:DedD protein